MSQTGITIMKSTLIRFLHLRTRAPAAIGAALLLAGIQAANARTGMAMQAMEGMHPAAEFRFGEPADAAKADRTVTITMRDLSFEPNALTVKAGETIRFVVTNKSEIDHDFTIGDVQTQTAHRAEMAEAMQKGEMGHGDDPNAMLVNAGQRRELIWKFTRAGRLEFDCNIPGHYEAGMRGVITVRARGANDADAGIPGAPAGADELASMTATR